MGHLDFSLSHLLFIIHRYVLLPGNTSNHLIFTSPFQTAVPPQNQADSYKRMENGEWVFGVDSLWVVAPTRHGAHNWEGPGESTAMTALAAFSKLTKTAAWIPSKALSDATVIAGHSMGGHGAWYVNAAVSFSLNTYFL